MSNWSYITYLPSLKVAYDKTADYVGYYLGYTNSDNSDNNSVHDDEINEYEDILNIQSYTDEKNNKRICQELGFYERYTIFFQEPTYVIDNIYLGSAYNAASYDILKKLDIKLIINVTTEITNYYPDDFTYVRYNLYDNNKHSIDKYLNDAYEKITNFQKNKQGNILIHCFMGASRSASMVIYYLMRTMKKENGDSFTFDDSLNFLKKKRPLVNPTFRFTKDLAKSISDLNIVTK